MDKTTEELKHEINQTLAFFQKLVDKRVIPDSTAELLPKLFGAYVAAIEGDAHAAALRLTETIRYNAVLSDAYTRQQQLTHAACVAEREAWAENHELRNQVRELLEANDNGCRVLMDLRESFDELRNKLQAFEFANKSAGELLRNAMATIRRQQKFIRTLYASRKARKSKGSTSAQIKRENAL